MHFVYVKCFLAEVLDLQSVPQTCHKSNTLPLEPRVSFLKAAWATSQEIEVGPDPSFIARQGMRSKP